MEVNLNYLLKREDNGYCSIFERMTKYRQNGSFSNPRSSSIRNRNKENRYKTPVIQGTCMKINPLKPQRNCKGEREVISANTSIIKGVEIEKLNNSPFTIVISKKENEKGESVKKEGKKQIKKYKFTPKHSSYVSRKKSIWERNKMFNHNKVWGRENPTIEFPRAGINCDPYRLNNPAGVVAIHLPNNLNEKEGSEIELLKSTNDSQMFMISKRELDKINQISPYNNS